MDRVAIATIKQWAEARDPADDLERFTEELRELLRGAEPPQPEEAADDDLPTPRLSADGADEQLGDAVCLLLQRFLSPAREGDPRLLSDLLHLTLRLRVNGACETVAGLLVGGAYRGVDGLDGPLDTQMLTVLHACGLDEEQRGVLRDLFGEDDAQPDGDAPEEPVLPAVPPPAPDDEPQILRGDQVPQVNDPDQVFAFIDAVKEGIGDRRAYADQARVSIRQADFVARAAAALGMIRIARGGIFEVTERGAALPFAEDPNGRAARHQAVGEHPLIRAAGLQAAETLPSLEQLQALIASRSELGAGTIRRRAQALRRWVEWWASGGT